MPGRWWPKVWGLDDDTMMPPADDIDQLNHLLGLVMRHYNSIVSDFEQHPPALSPLWNTIRFGTEQFEDAEMWAYGFTEAIKLTKTAWQPLFDHPEGRQWIHPIYLLGADDAPPEADELIRTPAQRDALAMQIEDSLLMIHAFWLPLRQDSSNHSATWQCACSAAWCKGVRLDSSNADTEVPAARRWTSTRSPSAAARCRRSRSNQSSSKWCS